MQNPFDALTRFFSKGFGLTLYSKGWARRDSNPLDGSLVGCSAIPNLLSDFNRSFQRAGLYPRRMN